MKKSLSFAVALGLLFALCMSTGVFAGEVVPEGGTAAVASDVVADVVADLSVAERISNVGAAFEEGMKEGIAGAANLLGTGADAVWSTWQGKTIVLLLVMKYTAGMAVFAGLGGVLKACMIVILLTATWIFGNKQLRTYYDKFLASGAAKATAEAKDQGSRDPWIMWRQGQGINIDGAGMYMVIWLSFNLTMLFTLIGRF